MMKIPFSFKRYQGQLKSLSRSYHGHIHFPHSSQFTAYFQKLFIFATFRSKNLLFKEQCWYWCSVGTMETTKTSTVNSLWPQGHDDQRNPEILWFFIKKNSNNLLAQSTFQRYPKINRSFLTFFFLSLLILLAVSEKFPGN